GVGEARVTPEVSLETPATVAVAGDHRLQHTAPVVGAGDVAIPQEGTFQVTVLVETEQWMVAGTLEVAVVGRTFLLPMRLTDRTVQVEDDAVGLTMLLNLADPLRRKVHQRREVVRLGQHLGLETCHPAGLGGLLLRGPAADHLSQDRIDGESVGIVEVVVTRQATVDRLTQP